MRLTYETRLIEVGPDDFDWMIRAESAARGGLKLPPGGVDDPGTLAIVRGIAESLWARNGRAAWMIISGDELVGLCSYRRPPNDGVVEIGYGVAESRRGRGHATHAVEAIALASKNIGVKVLLAETSIANPASGRVLEKNAFVTTGTRIDAEDGEVSMWQKYWRTNTRIQSLHFIFRTRGC